MYYIEFDGKFYCGYNTYLEPIFHTGIRKAFFRKEDAIKQMTEVEKKLSHRIKNWDYHKNFLRIVNDKNIKQWQRLDNPQEKISEK